jgi:hypothetical protein
MKWYMWAFILVAFTQMACSKVLLRLDDSIKMWKALTYLEEAIAFLDKILNRYSIWIFHCCVFTLLFATEVNYMSMCLCFVELIVFPLQLYEWFKSKEEVYMNIYKSWKFLFNMIVANCLYKYLTFFGRYITIKRVYRGFFDIFMPEKLMAFVMNWDNSNIDFLHNDFLYDTLIILLAFYTNTCILENSCREMTHGHIEGLGDKLIELAETKEQKKLIIEYRRTTTFTTLFLILKGLTFLFIGFHTMNHINAFKVILMLVPLIYYNFLFLKIIKSSNRFMIREMLHNCRLLLLPRPFVLLQVVCV